MTNCNLMTNIFLYVVPYIVICIGYIIYGPYDINI